MNPYRLLGIFALGLAIGTPSGVAAEVETPVPPSVMGSIQSMLEEGKLVHAARALDTYIGRYPTDPRLRPLRALVASRMAREMPPQKDIASIGAAPSAARPTLPASRSVEAGASFVTGAPDVAMIWIPPGSFTMSALHGSDDETQVTFSRGYWLGQTEVTQAQWQALMDEDPRPSYFKGSDRPVEWVAWGKALEFCRRLTDRERAAGRLSESMEYTLPTEAQWEYACRAGTTGIRAGDLDAMGWYDLNSGLQSHPGGQKKPNAWGLYDMYGNVYEWTFDSYGGYPGGQVVDPQPDLAANASSPRMIRGGGAGSSAGECRSASRYRCSPSFTSAGVGFRIALALPASPPAKEESPVARLSAAR